MLSFLFELISKGCGGQRNGLQRRLDAVLASTCMRGIVPAVGARRNGGGPEQAHEVEAQMEEIQPRMFRGQTRSEQEKKMGLRSEERVLKKKKMNMRHVVTSAVDQPVAHRWEFRRAHQGT